MGPIKKLLFLGGDPLSAKCLEIPKELLEIERSKASITKFVQ